MNKQTGKVHRSDCPYLPEMVNLEALGRHPSLNAAVRGAKGMHYEGVFYGGITSCEHCVE